MSESATTAEVPSGGLPPDSGEPGLFQRYGVTILFLGPALVLLGVWIVYPTIRTIIRSFYDRSGDEFIGFENYQTLFSDDTLVTAIKNNFLWLLIVPAFVTAVGPRVRRAARAHPLLGRLQGRGLHAHGDLAFRRRCDLAADVREGPRARNAQCVDRSS